VAFISRKIRTMRLKSFYLVLIKQKKKKTNSDLDILMSFSRN